MNIFKRIYCRTFQHVLKFAIPFLPYRQPELLKDYDGLIEVLRGNSFKNVLLVTDKSIKEIGLTGELESKLKGAGFKLFIYDKTVANPTSQNVEEGLKIFKDNGCQVLIAFGGGSSMDCAKAIGARVARPNKTLSQMKGILKVRKSLPLLIAVPTTAGTGSETTIASVITDSETRHKYAINDFPLIPKYALLEAKLTTGLPPKLTATTGMDALTHAVEAYIGKSTTKETRKNSIDAIKLIFDNLLVAYHNGNDLTARANMLKASYLAGLAFTKSYVGYVHAVAHSLGGKYNIPHGEANAILMPIVLKKYGKKVYKKLLKLCKAVGLCDKGCSKEVASKIFIEKIEAMNKEMGIDKRIPAIAEGDIKELVRTAEKEANPLYPVPVLWTAKQLEKIYEEAKNG